MHTYTKLLIFVINWASYYKVITTIFFVVFWNNCASYHIFTLSIALTICHKFTYLSGGTKSVIHMEIPKINCPAKISFTGTGDLFTALLLAWMAKTGGNLKVWFHELFCRFAWKIVMFWYQYGQLSIIHDFLLYFFLKHIFWIHRIYWLWFFSLFNYESCWNL